MTRTDLSVTYSVGRKITYDFHKKNQFSLSFLAHDFYFFVNSQVPCNPRNVTGQDGSRTCSERRGKSSIRISCTHIFCFRSRMLSRNSSTPETFSPLILKSSNDLMRRIHGWRVARLEKKRRGETSNKHTCERIKDRCEERVGNVTRKLYPRTRTSPEDGNRCTLTEGSENGERSTSLAPPNIPWKIATASRKIREGKIFPSCFSPIFFLVVSDWWKTQNRNRKIVSASSSPCVLVPVGSFLTYFFFLKHCPNTFLKSCLRRRRITESWCNKIVFGIQHTHESEHLLKNKDDMKIFEKHQGSQSRCIVLIQQKTMDTSGREQKGYAITNSIKIEYPRRQSVRKITHSRKKCDSTQTNTVEEYNFGKEKDYSKGSFHFFFHSEDNLPTLLYRPFDSTWSIRSTSS